MPTFEQEVGPRLPPHEQVEPETSPDRQNALLLVSGILFGVTFLGVLQPPGGTNDKGQTKLKLHYFVPYVIFNTIASTASSLYIFEVIGKSGTGFLFHVAVVGIAMAYGSALVSISEESAKKFGALLPVIVLLVLLGYRYVKARCCCNYIA